MFSIFENGTFNLATADDAIHAEGSITVQDGNLTITGCYEGIESPDIIVVYASTGDRIESNDDFTLTKGTVVVHGLRPNPEVGMDVNGAININGGFLVISGINSYMTQTASSNSAQYSILARSNIPRKLFSISRKIITITF